MPRAHVLVSYEHIILLLGTESLCWNTAYPPALLAQNICHIIFSLLVLEALTRHEQIDPSLLTPSPLPITAWSLGLLVVVLLPVLLRCEQTFWGGLASAQRS